jgi:hypothetical protein
VRPFADHFDTHHGLLLQFGDAPADGGETDLVPLGELGRRRITV